MREREKEREIQTEIFHLMTYFQITTMMLEVRNFIWVSSVGAGVQ